MGNLANRYKDTSAEKPSRSAEKIITGLKEAIAVVEGKAEPARVHHAKGGRPRIGQEDSTLSATRPWEALNMSRRTWQRRQAEKRL